MKLSRGKPTTQPTPAKAVYVQTQDALPAAQDKHDEAKLVSPLQRLIQENAAAVSVVEKHHDLDELPAHDAQQISEQVLAIKAVSPASPMNSERPDGFDNIAAQRSVAGRLIDHGEAPYNHDKQEKPSYFVTYEHNGKQHTIWGKDLHNALAKANVDKGDYVQLDFLGSQPIKVLTNIMDEKGKKVGEEWQTKHFNIWRGKEVDADYCATFTPKEKPFVKKDARSSQIQSGGKSNYKKPETTPAPKLAPQEQQQHNMAPVPGKAGSGIGAALGGMLGGLHRAGSAMASQLTGSSKRDFSHRQRAEKHEQLLSAMTYSAARASAAATALASGELAPVISDIKQRGVELNDVLNTNKYPDLKDRYSDIMENHGGAVRTAMGELDWYATRAAESAKERGIDIQPEVDEVINNVKENAKDIALPDEQGKWTSISDTLDKVLEKVHELIRQIFARFAPGSSQS